METAIPIVVGVVLGVPIILFVVRAFQVAKKVEKRIMGDEE
jgi:hypothetical protein